jgi:hypothetical protein
MNESVKNLRDILLDQFDALSAKMDNTTDPAMAQAIVTEMKEILHRVDLVQNLLMRETADSLKTAIANVKKADQKLKDSLRRITEVADLVKSVTNFLSCVDKAIDIAKTL